MREFYTRLQRVNAAERGLTAEALRPQRFAGMPSGNLCESLRYRDATREMCRGSSSM
jgi:hypothetical protein